MITRGGHHWLERKDAGGATVVRVLPPRLMGDQTCREVFGLLYGLVDETECNRLVLDLGRVKSLDSHGVGKLVLLNRKAQATGGRLALCNLTPQVAAMLDRLNLLGVFEVFGGEEEAVVSFPLPLATVSEGC
jgi:anti-anti-sigma factor